MQQKPLAIGIVAPNAHVEILTTLPQLLTAYLESYLAEFLFDIAKGKSQNSKRVEQ